MRRLRLRLEGVVQGVGFRPFVHRLATQLRLGGSVVNTGHGVTIELEGDPASLERFVRRLERERPPHSRLDRLERTWLAPGTAPPAGTPRFTIQAPAGGEAASGAAALIPPDLAPCPACLEEMRDPANRRFAYPFISCTHCGPRYSVLRALPFERALTSLAAFPLCPACQAEYGDPADRRFHAQTTGCPACGPRLRWCDGGGRSLASGPQALAAATDALRAGAVVALKGLGGFQLLVPAAAEAAVAELRRRKGRPDKPFALLVPDPAWARRHCALDAAEEALLRSAAAPIVLLRRRADAGIAAGVAPGSPFLGVMLPATPLHALLLEALGTAVVATSGNRSGEPLCFDDAEALDQLGGIADGFLLHDREIVNPVDDAIAQVAAGRPMLLRHARGWAPTALDLTPLLSGPSALGGVVALGGELKASLALGDGGRVLLGPYLGDLESEAAERRLRGSLRQASARQGLEPRRIVVDRHPGYRSRRIGQELAAEHNLALLEVQHHHAHLLACLAEHGLPLPQLGVAWDGAGYGADGSLWGGECLRLEGAGFERLAQLRPFPLPGGERAMREPRRAALGLLFAACGSGAPPLLPAGAFTAEETQVLVRALERGVNAPLCSSVGRLFDAIASLLGLIQRCSFEGQAALRLEGAALEARQRGERPPVYAIPLRAPPAPPAASAPCQLDWQPLLEAVLADQAAGRGTGVIALGVHQALAVALPALASRFGERRLLLSGGCFQNRLLLELAVEALAQSGVDAVWPQRVPCNDGGLALGQLLAAGLTAQ